MRTVIDAELKLRLHPVGQGGEVASLIYIKGILTRPAGDDHSKSHAGIHSGRNRGERCSRGQQNPEV
jgi:hypothetical protein